MNKYFLIKYIVDALQPLYPAVKIGIPEKSEGKDIEEVSRERVPVDYVCKGLCSLCKYNHR